jgi:hypothetical protein
MSGHKKNESCFCRHANVFPLENKLLRVNSRQLKSNYIELSFIMKQTVIVNNSTNINKTNSHLSCQTFEHDIGFGNLNFVLGHANNMSMG